MYPKHHRALILDKIGSPLRVDDAYPTPRLTSGSAVVKVLAAGILSYSRDVYNGVRKYTLPEPSVPGSGAIGRIVAVGADATTLKGGDLVLCDVYLRGRDNHDVGALSGIHDGHTDAAKQMMHGEWRDGSYAEYVKLPLENLFVLNEQRLLGNPDRGLGLGYSVEDLLRLIACAVPYGGFVDVGLSVCETVLVSPATGMFGSAAVHVAVAMGANVIAMGRNADALEKLKRDVTKSYPAATIQTVRITNDTQEEMSAIAKIGTPIDVFFDISPPMASGSSHFKSGILSVRYGGRVSLMGGIRSDVGMPLNQIVHRNLTIKGKWMFEREDIPKLIRLAESGRLKLGKAAGCEIVGKFGLEKWEEAFDMAARESGPGKTVALIP